ncbi:MAG: hypothetical protein ACW98X_15205 [Promethearchaeota archaeon]
MASKFFHTFNDLGFFLYISFIEKKVKNNYPAIFLITNEQKKYLNFINSKNIIHSVGLYFGFIKKSTFFLSLEGAEFLYENKFFSESHHLILNKNGEKSFLYGNNISKKMVENVSKTLKHMDFLLVLNNRNEIIGISQSKYDHQIIPSLNPNDIIAINLSDKGNYLRKNQ